MPYRNDFSSFCANQNVVTEANLVSCTFFSGGGGGQVPLSCLSKLPI